MKLNTQKKLAAKVAKVSPKRIRLNLERMDDIKESITKADIKGLINDGAIFVLKKKGVSRGRANKIKVQKSKGRRKGPGSRKGTANARAPKKDLWMKRIRLQRELLRILKEKKLVSTTHYRELYNKAKGGFFRSRRHLKLYIQENGMINGK